MIFKRLILTGGTALALAAMLLLGSGALGDENEKALQLRAAFLLNFVKFTQWPDDAFDSTDSPITVAVLGDDPFGSILEQTFHDRAVHGRSIAVERFSIPSRRDYRSDDAYQSAFESLLARISRSHVVYLNIDAASMRRTILEQLASAQVLTVGHDRDHGRNGTILSLDEDRSKIVFYVNMQSLDDSRLKISSKLLRLARQIDADRGGRNK